MWCHHHTSRCTSRCMSSDVAHSPMVTLLGVSLSNSETTSLEPLLSDLQHSLGPASCFLTNNIFCFLLRLSSKCTQRDPETIQLSEFRSGPSTLKILQWGMFGEYWCILGEYGATCNGACLGSIGAYPQSSGTASFTVWAVKRP